MSLKERLSALFTDRSRRSFLQACGVLGLGFGASVAADRLLGRRTPSRSSIDAGPKPLPSSTDGRLRVTRVAMGTFVTITAIDPANERLVDAVESAFAEVARLESLLSRHNPDSPLSLLNLQRSLQTPPPELADVLRHSAAIGRQTLGCFEPTVAPVIDWLKSAAQRHRLGDEGVLFDDRGFRDAVARIDPKALRLERSVVRLAGNSAILTLDGIAKGYIVDRVAELLQRKRVAHFMIDAGGDIRVFSRARRRAWTIAVEDPNKRGNYPDVIRLDHGAVATSGSYEVFFDANERLHHLIDPHTGRPANRQRSVTTIAPTVMLADALSTAVFVASSRERRAILRRHRSADLLLIGADGSLVATAGWWRHSLRRSS
ncbi:MAG: FAD:protein FMN transferase [Myxococcales bacterium]|nr:FAD:protein FMN transferase [Myxococcales bacterium]